jgi:hypothetical protein
MTPSTTIYLVLYESGLCGNLVLQILNAHNNFPHQKRIGSINHNPRNYMFADHKHYDREFTIVDEGYLSEHYDEILNSNDGVEFKKPFNSGYRRHYSDPQTADETLANLDYESNVFVALTTKYQSGLNNYIVNSDGNIQPWANSRLLPPRGKGIKVFKNDRFSKIAFVPSPFHAPGFFVEFPSYISDNTEYQVKYIMITASADFNRIKKDKQWKLERMSEYDDLISIFDIMDKPLMELDIVSLLDKSDSEYQKLLDFIGEDSLDNWKDMVDVYKAAVNL